MAIDAFKELRRKGSVVQEMNIYDNGQLAKRAMVEDVVTMVTTILYTVISTDHILFVTRTLTSACVITIPETEVYINRKIVIVDAGYNANVNKIIITNASGDILNDASLEIVGDGDSVSLICDGTNFHQGA